MYSDIPFYCFKYCSIAFYGGFITKLVYNKSSLARSVEKITTIIRPHAEWSVGIEIKKGMYSVHRIFRTHLPKFRFLNRKSTFKSNSHVRCSKIGLDLEKKIFPRMCLIIYDNWSCTRILCKQFAAHFSYLQYPIDEWHLCCHLFVMNSSHINSIFFSFNSIFIIAICSSVYLLVDAMLLCIGTVVRYLWIYRIQFQYLKCVCV